MNLIRDKSIGITFDNDVLDFYVDYFSYGSFGGGSGSRTVNPPSTYPLYYQGEKVATGFDYRAAAFYQTDSGMKTLDFVVNIKQGWARRIVRRRGFRPCGTMQTGTLPKSLILSVKMNMVRR